NQPDGAVPPRRPERQRLLRPRGHPVQRRRPAAGEPELGLGQQLEHGAGHLLASDDPDHHHHHHHHDDSGADDHHHDHDAADHDDIDSHDDDHDLDEDHARGGQSTQYSATGSGGVLHRLANTYY